MKYVVIVPDGMADRPVRALGGLTPLEAARKPNMDAVARRGSCGMAKMFHRGLPYDSSIANMGILGYDPRRYFCGRSPLEAANVGVGLGAGDIALRCNLVTLVGGKMADFTAGHISSDEARSIMSDLSAALGGGGVEFYPGTSYRNLMVIRRGLRPSLDFSAKPPHDIVGSPVKDNMPRSRAASAAVTAGLLRQLIRRSWAVLAEHPVNLGRMRDGMKPANSIWLWGAGRRPRMPSFSGKFGVRGSLVSAVDLLKGLGKVIGMDVLSVDGATGYLDTNYEGKAESALRSLESCDLTYVHLESTDEAGHEGSLEHKIKAIEDIDRKIVGRILDGLEGDYRVLLMPDHPTPIEVRTHTSEPVPYVLLDSRLDAAGAEAYTERSIKSKSVRTVEAHTLMRRLVGG